MSFRLRLLLTSLAILAVGLGALVLAGNVLLSHRVRGEATSLLRARVDAQLAALRVTPGSITVRATVNEDLLDRRAWIFEQGRVIERPPGVSPALDRVAVALGRAGTGAERDAPGDLRLRAAPIIAPGSRAAVGAVVVGLSVSSLEDLQHRVLVGSLIIAVLVLLAGGLAIRSALDGALHPVAEMTRAAEDWGAHDLDRRFDLGAPRDELTGLAATLDHLLARIAASRRHEQRFAAEVAHELRTPIAGLRGRAELALDSGNDGEREAALRAVVTQADRLDQAVETLLGVASRDLDPQAGTVDLVAVAHEFGDLRVQAPDGLPSAAGDPDVVRRALAPLVENARRHARSAVTLELDAPPGRVRITVCDDGPGLDSEIGERAFDPGVRGPAAPGGGAGLGLPLARRLARSCGGDVVARPGAGGRFALELPAVGA